MNPTLLNPSVPSTIHRRLAAGGLALVAALMLAACATPKPVAEPEVAVRERANARWQTLMAGNFAKAYTFNAPSVKEKMTEAAYIGQFANPQWTGAEVVNVTCAQPTACVARVKVTIKIAIPRSTTMSSITTHVDESWQLAGGEWGFLE
jgi:hypothetical protein